VKTKTSKRILKIIQFFNKRIGPILLFAILIACIILPELNFLNMPLKKLLVIIWFSVIALMFILAFYEGIIEGIMIKRKRVRLNKEKDNWWQEHPPEKRVIMTDKNNGEIIGAITNEQLRFLIDVFTEEQMEENDFCFVNELFDLFVEEKKPGPSLIEFIRNALNGKDEIILHWEKEE
jgi:hypothetical protein